MKQRPKSLSNTENLLYDIIDALGEVQSTVQASGASPLDKYGLSDEDQTLASPKYFGFLDKDTNWYILRVTTTGAEKVYEYITGSGGYGAAWAGRAGLVYTDFASAF